MAELGRALVTDARSSFGCVELLSEHQAASFLEPHSFLILQGRRAAGNRVRLRYTGAEPDKVVQHAYDLFNRRVKRTIDPDGAKGSTAIEQSIFVYQSEQIALHFDKTGAGDLAASDLTHRYLWGLVFDQILCDEGVSALNTAGSNLWPLGDHLDTVRDLAEYNSGTDTTTIVNHRVYDSFGRLTSESAPAVTHLFQFTARPFDPATGLQNNLHRWCDAAVGRWLSEDPIGFAGADANLYRYVRNEPVLRVDPEGLSDSELDPYLDGPLRTIRDERKRLAAKRQLMELHLKRARQARLRIDQVLKQVGRKLTSAKDGSVTDIDAEVREVERQAFIFFDALDNAIKAALREGLSVAASSALGDASVAVHTPSGFNMLRVADPAAVQRFVASVRAIGPALEDRERRLGQLEAGMKAVEKTGRYAGYLLVLGAWYQAGKEGGRWAVCKAVAVVAVACTAGEGINEAARAAGASEGTLDAIHLANTLVTYAILKSRMVRGKSPGRGGPGKRGKGGSPHAPGDVPDDYVIAKGGTKPPPKPGQTFSGAQGRDLYDAGRGVPHGQVQPSTAGKIRSQGGRVDVAPERTRSGTMNYRHVNVTEGGRSTTFGPPTPNPAPKADRIK